MNNILITSNKQLILIDIKDGCTMKEYITITKNYTEKISIPIRSLILTGSNLMKSNLCEQKILLFNNENISYIVTISNNKIIISSNKYNSDGINEVEIKMDLSCNTYSISKYLHDLDSSTKECKIFPNDTGLDIFGLDEEEANLLYIDVLNNLKNINFIDNLFDINKLDGLFDNKKKHK